MTIDDNSHREVDRRGHRDTEGPTVDDPLGDYRDLGTGRVWQGGANVRSTQQRKQARGTGRRDEQRSLSGGRWGKSPCGR